MKVATKGSEVAKAKSKQEADNRSQVLIGGVLGCLGRPRNLHKVTAHNVYGSRWRVDVWCYARKEYPTIEHSYFVKSTDGGEIITSDPQIAKLY